MVPDGRAAPVVGLGQKGLEPGLGLLVKGVPLGGAKGLAAVLGQEGEGGVLKGHGGRLRSSGQRRAWRGPPARRLWSRRCPTSRPPGR